MGLAAIKNIGAGKSAVASVTNGIGGACLAQADGLLAPRARIGIESCFFSGCPVVDTGPMGAMASLPPTPLARTRWWMADAWSKKFTQDVRSFEMRVRVRVRVHSWVVEAAGAV